MDISSLRIYLRSEQFLSDDDMERLKPSPPDYVGRQVIESLANLVYKRGKDGLQKFMSALHRSADEDDHSGHKELFELLQRDYVHRSGSMEFEDEIGSTTYSGRELAPQETGMLHM